MNDKLLLGRYGGVFLTLDFRV